MKIVIMGLFLLLTASSAAARDVELTKREKEMVAEIIKSGLIDPDSARFQLPDTINAGDGYWFYCGLVNSRNRFGGYTGWAPFEMGLLPGESVEWGDKWRLEKRGIEQVGWLKIGTADPKSPKSQFILKSCAELGFRFEVK
jgi:hypothetical protein